MNHLSLHQARHKAAQESLQVIPKTAYQQPEKNINAEFPFIVSSF
jgi:hypothetical protein